MAYGARHHCGGHFYLRRAEGTLTLIDVRALIDLLSLSLYVQ
jgi:hypothetical protein